MIIKFEIEFETDKGERFWALCNDVSSHIAAATREYPTKRFTIRTVEVLP